MLLYALRPSLHLHLGSRAADGDEEVGLQAVVRAKVLGCLVRHERAHTDAEEAKRLAPYQTLRER